MQFRSRLRRIWRLSYRPLNRRKTTPLYFFRTSSLMAASYFLELL
ncbi:hypothetical protein O59_003306 [Cellvibrio sp. BR]|nr:hypothetical protein O59_003306 [Cellvibrio sp. BR]